MLSSGCRGSGRGAYPRGAVHRAPRRVSAREHLGRTVKQLPGRLEERSEAVIWVLVAIVVVLVCVVGVLALRQRRTARLREGFGPEYDRVVQERGDQRAGEAELQQRRERRSSYDIRSLAAEERDGYAERWEATQRQFVDKPASALGDADRLVREVMSKRGYPVRDFEQQAADLSVDHPAVVEHYRAAHAVSRANAEQQASTEDLRQAMVHYRALFDDLLARSSGDGDGAGNEVKEVR
jgi:hypothetical protein